MAYPNRFYPPLTAEEFFFAYPDNETTKEFLDLTLGRPYTGIESIDVMVASVLDMFYRKAPKEYSIVVPAVFIRDMPVNVAVISVWLYLQEHCNINAHPMSGYLGDVGMTVVNRPVTLALTNDLVVGKTGEIEGDMDIESTGLIDCARRVINQMRQTGLIVSPIKEVHDDVIKILEARRAANGRSIH